LKHASSSAFQDSPFKVFCKIPLLLPIVLDLDLHKKNNCLKKNITYISGDFIKKMRGLLLQLYSAILLLLFVAAYNVDEAEVRVYSTGDNVELESLKS